MLLQRAGITISRAKTQLNWLRKRTMRAVAMAKFQPFITSFKSGKKHRF